MNARMVLAQLEKLGKANTLEIYRRHGVTGLCFGVSYADITRLTKSIECDHALSLELWKSGVHDARVLAAKLADASRMTEQHLEDWVSQVDNYVLDDAVASLAARSSLAHAIAKKWTRSPDEWRAAAGFSIVAILAVDGRLPLTTAKALLPRIQRNIHAARNRVRYAMNGALIAIGGSIASLREASLEVAEAIGQVEVDHGETGCKTPDAAGYIRNMAARSPARSSVKGARLAARRKATVGPNHASAKGTKASRSATKRKQERR